MFSTAHPGALCWHSSHYYISPWSLPWSCHLQSATWLSPKSLHEIPPPVSGSQLLLLSGPVVTASGHIGSHQAPESQGPGFDRSSLEGMGYVTSFPLLQTTHLPTYSVLKHGPSLNIHISDGMVSALPSTRSHREARAPGNCRLPGWMPLPKS